MLVDLCTSQLCCATTMHRHAVNICLDMALSAGLPEAFTIFQGEMRLPYSRVL